VFRDRNLVRAIVRQALRRLGFDVVRFPAPPEPRNGSSFERRRSRWLASSGTSVVLDVGANVGQYAQHLRQEGYSGRIVSFEPQTRAFRDLEAASRADPHWKALNVGLGAEDGTMDINLAANSESSSVLPMETLHVDAYPASAYVGRETIRVARLDTLRDGILQPQDFAWLKMDVQGYEIAVLQGAGGTLDQVRAIEMELSIVKLYRGSLLLCEAIEVLSRLGFRLVAVEDAFLDQRNGHALQLNGIFMRVPDGGPQHHNGSLE
jgi:FkbM family methyltransferase